MSNEILNLRRLGKFDEGIALGEKLLGENKTDLWDRKALFWCYFDKVKSMVSNGLAGHAEEYVQKMNLLIKKLDNDKLAAQNLEKIKRTLIPEYTEIANAVELSKQTGQEKIAYETVLPYFETSSTALHEELGWILYRFIKSQIDVAPSIEVRRLLAKYIKMENPRPSMLHSLILQLALSFAKEHSDFIFYKFLDLWNPKNLRGMDYHQTQNDEKSFSPLVERIIIQLIDSKAPLTPTELHNKLNPRKVNISKIAYLYRNRIPGIESMSHEEICSKLKLPIISMSRLIEIYRERAFWNIYNLSKQGKCEEVWKLLNSYNEQLSSYPADVWHSKVLSLALRTITETYMHKFIVFVLGWGVDKLRDEDWHSEKGKDGNEYPSLASMLLSKIYEYFKADSHCNTDSTKPFLSIFEKGAQILSSDHWPKYRYAKMLLWSNEPSLSFNLLKSLSSALNKQPFYWQDLASAANDIHVKSAFKLKAISLQKDETFLGNVRLDMAAILLDFNLPQYAKVELMRYRNFRLSQNKSMHESFNHLWNRVTEIKPEEENYMAYIREMCDKAVEILYDDLPWQLFVVSDFWKLEDGNECVTLVSERHTAVNVKKNKFKVFKHIKRGQIVELKIDRSSSIKHDVVMVRLTNKENWSIMPLKVGIVNHITDDNTAYVYIPESTQSIKIEHSTLKLKSGIGVSFRLIVKKKDEKTLMRAEAVSVLNNEKWKDKFPYAEIVIDNVNNDKKLYHFVGLNNIDGIIKFQDETPKYKVGDCLGMKYFLKGNKSGSASVEAIEINRLSRVPSSLVKEVYGEISIPDSRKGGKKDYGFLENCFIPPNLLRYGSDECYAEGKAHITKDGKWRVFEIDIKPYGYTYEDEDY